MSSMFHKLELLVFFSSVMLLHFTAGFSSKCDLTIETRENKSVYSGTTSVRERERDHRSTVSALFKVSSLQSILHSQTVDSSLLFPAPSSPQRDPSFLSLVLSIYVICYFKQQPTPDMYTVHTHNLTIWPILAQIGAQVVQRRNTQPPAQQHRSEHHWQCSQVGNH